MENDCQKKIKKCAEKSPSVRRFWRETRIGSHSHFRQL